MLRIYLVFVFFARLSYAQVVDGFLVFPAEKNQIHLEEKEVTYDFGRSSSFRFSSFEYDYQDIGAQLATIVQRTTEFYNSSYIHHRVLGLRWPIELIEYGDIEIYEYGENKPVLKTRLSQNAQREWWTLPERLKEEKRLSWGKTKLRFLGEKMPFAGVNYGIHPVSSDFKKWLRKPFRFCVTEENPSSWVRFCSPYLQANLRGKIQHVPQLLEREYVYQINGKKAKISGILPFSDRFDFNVRSRNGFSFAFKGAPIKAEIDQIVEAGQHLEVIGHGVAPHRAKSLDGSARLLEKLGWKDTILPKKKYWKLKIDKKKPFISALTAGAQFVGYTVVGENEFPQKRDRIAVDQELSATYSRRGIIEGSCQRECRLEALGKDRVSVQGKTFKWEVDLPRKQGLNSNLIAVLSGDKRWLARSQIFRSSSSELSLRSSGTLTEESDFSILGEVSASHWFEDLFGWQNQLLSKQRWGVSARYFQSLSDVQVATGSDLRSWSSSNVDLKYRFSPGVWGVKESVGLNLSFQQTTLGGLNLPLVGGGLFWAKSMPEVFDRLIRWLPFMDYPKWVDMEVVFFPLSLSSDAGTDLMWNLNFHGKVMWRPWIFGELGFGVRSVNVIDNVNLQRLAFYSPYVTAGLGIQF